jgi:hypothetical protein
LRKDERVTMRLPTEGPNQRWPNVLLVALFVLVEMVWGLALVYLVLRFL